MANKNVMPCCIADPEMPVSKLKDGERFDMMNLEEYKNEKCYA